MTRCRRCNSKLLVEKEEFSNLTPMHYDFEVKYTMVYTYCVDCADEVITPAQSKINEERFLQAKKEAQILYKMREWIENE